MKIAALAGGVGGAKMADGLARNLPPGDLTVIVNTADDFDHLGLHISPDLDTVCYTLAGLANPRTGWGRRNETWNALRGVERLGGPTWFQIGDHDLSTHLERTRRLQRGEPLSTIVGEFCAAWGVRSTVLPMTDAQVTTIVHSEQGELAFQQYFVQMQCEPRVAGFEFRGVQDAAPAPGVVESLKQAEGIVICPSNPWVSIGPILSVAGLGSAMAKGKTIAVSPIVGGKAIRGPAAKMYAELGVQPSAAAVAAQYQEYIAGFVMDRVDRHLEAGIRDMGLRTLVTKTVMRTTEDRRRLGAEVLDFVQEGMQ
ncbi:MAG: 2-phospho-L-lactate transferase [Anaerolineales bacterium]